MCLKIKSGPHVAKKDFFVLKIGKFINKKGFTAPYRGTLYSYNSVYTSKIETELGIFYKEVEKGLHSLLVDNAHKSSWSVHPGGYWGSGLFSSGLLLCKISKGATYYLGINGDVASNKLEVLVPIITSEENSDAIEDGEQISHTTFSSMAKAAEEWVKNAGYNIKPS